jgi:hypothetical protein
VGIRCEPICRRQINPCISALSVACLSVFFVFYSCLFVANPICRRQINPCLSALSVACLSVLFRALSPHLAGQAWPFVANPFAAGKSIRAYPRYPWPAFLYFSCPLCGLSWLPFFAAGKSIRGQPFCRRQNHPNSFAPHPLPPASPSPLCGHGNI